MFNWFKRKEEVREVNVTADTLLAELTKRETITKEKAMSIPAVATAVEFIASSVASCPVKLYEKSDNGIKELADDNRLKLLNLDTGDLLNANQMKQAFIKDYLLDGNGYIFVNRKGTNIESLHYVDDIHVSISTGADPIYKDAQVFINGRRIYNWDLLRLTRNSVDGIQGKGLITELSQLLKTMLVAGRYEYSSMLSSNKRGFLQSDCKLDKESVIQLKNAWREFTNDETQDNVLVLNKGITYTPSAQTSAETQLAQNKASNASSVYSWFGLSDNLLTGGNTESYINNIKTCVIPIVKQLNNALNAYLLTEKEKGTLYFEVDTNELLKTTLSDRFNAYSTALASGILQVDEVRKMENLSPIGLDFVKLSLADCLYYPKDGTIYTPNTNSTVKIGEQPLDNNPDA